MVMGKDLWRKSIEYELQTNKTNDHKLINRYVFISIYTMLDNLLMFTDQKSTTGPLFEAKLELHVPEMVFLPSLDFGVADGYYDEIDGLVGDIYKQSSLIPRLAEHSGQQHYQVNSKILLSLLVENNASQEWILSHLNQ